MPLAAGSANLPITIHPLAPSNKFSNILTGAIVTVTNPASCAVTIKDGPGGTPIPLVPVNTPIGVYSVDLFGMRSVGTGSIDTTANPGGWFATLGAGVSVVFVGRIS